MTTSVKLISITPDAENLIAYCARVSNPTNQEKPVGRLLSYCMEHGHWSVFEMANAVVEINTTRDIARQLLRHRSFSFQEFSQRYAEPSLLGDSFVMRDARLQDTKNRQNSLETDDQELQNWFDYQTWYIQDAARRVYDDAIAKGIAKEVARSVLPEGLTMSRMYVNGTIRSWLHYLNVREGNGTQKEHVAVANQVRDVLKEHLPNLLGTE
jgi:thymidylate synthase (FAD)